MISPKSRTLGKNNQLFPSKNNEDIEQQAILRDIQNNLQQNSFFQQCQLFNYQLITLNDEYKYDILVLHQNFRFYCNTKGILEEKDLKTQETNYYALGKLYKTQYDKNLNPNFETVEGKMFISLSNRNFQLHGQGTIYQGKSDIVKISGRFFKGALISNNQYLNISSIIQNKKQQDNSFSKKMDIVNLTQNINFKIPQQKNDQYLFQLIIKNNKQKDESQKKIIARPNSAQNSRLNYREIEKRKQLDLYQTRIRQNNLNYKKIWCKYNQQINESDELKLNMKSKAWLNSSIIDSYVMHLNIEGEALYFKKNQDDRANIQRVLFIPSSFITSLGDEFDIEKAKGLFFAELRQYQEINLEIRRLYSLIGFIINRKNIHWQFLIFDLTKNQIQLFDSQLNIYLNDDALTKIIQILEQLLYINNCQIELAEESGQQLDGYSCGYQICTYMKYCYEKQFNMNTQYQYHEQHIKNILQQVIIDLEVDQIDS